LKFSKTNIDADNPKGNIRITIENIKNINL